MSSLKINVDFDLLDLFIIKYGENSLFSDTSQMVHSLEKCRYLYCLLQLNNKTNMRKKNSSIDS